MLSESKSVRDRNRSNLIDCTKFCKILKFPLLNSWIFGQIKLCKFHKPEQNWQKKVRHQVYEKFCMQRKLKLNFALCNIENSTIGLESLKAVKCDWLHLCNKQQKTRETQNCCTGHLLKLVLIWFNKLSPGCIWLN